MKLNDTLLSLCNGSPEKFLALTPVEIIEWGRANPALLAHVALSQEHHAKEAADKEKKRLKEEKRLAKEAEKAAKLAQKLLLESMTPEARKEFKRQQKIQKQLDQQNAPKLNL